ncbi:sporulation protein YpjB [Paenibacillus tarimensis]|uniref:sporulation protein YpjB n=1 Tax=Paenibacillus tarimensis TaxID=416012 RepID=UPI001F45F0C5|nr:sporulation protein YpjB [Paenibacillus tarimensis]MCF2942573.1 sporulation protein YpjB [Paenibacillus tarimensis]
MKFHKLMLLLAALLICSGYAQASGEEAVPPEGGSKLEQLAVLADGFYQASMDSNRQLAYSYLTRLKRLTADAELRQIGNREGWHAVDERVIKAESSVKDGRTAYRWREEATQLRLAVDALAKEHQSLWMQYEQLLRDDLGRLKQAWKRGGRDGAQAAQAALSQLKQHTERLETAAYVARGAEPVNLLKDRISYTAKLIRTAEDGDVKQSWVDQSLLMLTDAIDQLFEPGEQAVDVPVAGSPAWQWMFTISLIILAALFYTGLQKYRFDRDGITPARRG